MDDEAPRVVTVEIMGQRYPIKSALDLEYITGLAEYVDEKIQSATDHSTTVWPGGVGPAIRGGHPQRADSLGCSQVGGGDFILGCSSLAALER